MKPPQNLEKTRTLTKALLKANERLGIDLIHQYQSFEIDSDSALRLTTGQRLLDPKLQEWHHAISLLNSYAKLCKLLGDDDPTRIAVWMASENNDLGCKPIQLLNEIDGIERLEEYLSTYLYL